jgi:anaerobic ribonucleoside-triphosphate reductase activating protein
MTPESQSLEGGEEISVERIAEMILKTDGIEGITITGGEPFEQSKSIVKLLKILQDEHEHGVIVYSGYTLDQLKQKNSPIIEEFLGLIDILIDGQYIEMLNDGKALRGSANQIVHHFTDRYKNVFNLFYDQNIREIEIHMKQENMMIVGIPNKESFLFKDRLFLST